MGWTVEVHEYVTHQAVCHESLPAWPLPPHVAGPEPARCTWRGPMRADGVLAGIDAAGHRAAHAEGWAAYNDALDAER